MKSVLVLMLIASMILIGCLLAGCVQQPAPEPTSTPQEPVVETPTETPTVPSATEELSDTELDDLTIDLEGVDELFSDLEENGFEDLEIDEKIFE